MYDIHIKQSKFTVTFVYIMLKQKQKQDLREGTVRGRRGSGSKESGGCGKID